MSEKIIKVTPIQVRAAKLRLAVDKARGVTSSPGWIKVANAEPSTDDAAGTPRSTV